MWRDRHDTESDEISPVGALLHPAWLVALVVLVVNDHLLKDLFAGAWVTGKLSDVAGLVVAPVLLAALVGVKRRRGLWVCAGVISAIYTALNVSPAAAALWDTLMRTVAFGWVTTSSWTDLLALPAVPLGIAVLMPAMQRPPGGRARRVAGMTLAMIGGLACLATSPPPEENPPRGQQTFQARIALHNTTHELQVFRLRQLRDDVEIDCERVAEAPQEYLTDAMFTQPTRWELLSDQQIGLDTGSARGGVVDKLEADECDAALVALETAPNIVVFWSGELEGQTFEHNPSGPQEDSGKAPSVELIGDYFRVSEEDMNPYRAQPCDDSIPCGQEGRQQLSQIPDGAAYAWNSRADSQLHFEWPDRNERDRREIPRSCEPVGPGEGLAWEDIPSGRQRTVHGFDAGEDGCHTLELGTRGAPDSADSYVVCAPEAALAPLKPSGDVKPTIDAGPIAEQPPSGDRYFGLRLDVERGAESGQIWLTQGTAVPALEDTELTTKLRQGCGPVAASCDLLEVAADIRVPGRDDTFEPGESAEFEDGGTSKRVHLVRSVYRPAAMPAPSCEGEPTAVEDVLGANPGHYMEAATVVGLSGPK